MFKEHNQSDKKKLAQKGKALDRAKIESKAFAKYGKSYRKELAQILKCSEVNVSYAFSGRGAFYLLYQINQLLKTN